MSSHASHGERLSFLRHCLTQTGVLESICCNCGERVAFSPDPGIVRIAEDDHACVPQGKTASAKAGSTKR